MNYQYYKKIDRSMMDWGFTIPKQAIEYFDKNNKVLPGRQTNIEIIWDKKIYEVKLCHVNRKAGRVYQLRWDNNKEFLKKLRKI